MVFRVHARVTVSVRRSSLIDSRDYAGTYVWGQACTGSDLRPGSNRAVGLVCPPGAAALCRRRETQRGVSPR